MSIATLNDLAGDGPIRAQVAVVGSGPAGAEVAAFLAARGRDVVVLESGRAPFHPRTQSLNDAVFLGMPHRSGDDDRPMHEYLPPEMRGVNRIRALGGTSVVWTGKWRRLGPWDLRGRDWISFSGWPLPYGELADAYDEVCRDYALDLPAGGRAGDGFDDTADALRRVGCKVVPFFQHDQPYRAADRLRALDGLRIVTDATVVRIDLAEGADRVAGVLCRSLDGAEREVRADHVVLAAGGLESPRLLLMSNHQRPEGLGNGRDLLGRFFQDHVKLNRVAFRPGPAMSRFATLFQTAARPRRMACVALPEAMQERLGVAEANLFLRPCYDAPLARRVNALLGRRGVRDGHGAARRYVAKYAIEQTPNPDSRLLLSRERDALGLPKLAIDWRLTEFDRRGFEVSARALQKLLLETGLGRLELDDTAPLLEQAMDSAHHMGATRMGAHPRAGVVDGDCALFDAPNLHVASSSVFPTGGAYSPTLTIVALARRLAKRLDHLLSRPVETTQSAAAR